MRRLRGIAFTGGKRHGKFYKVPEFMASDRHQQYDEKLSAYIDGELSPEDAGSLRQAMTADPSIRSSVETLMRIRDELQSIRRYELPADFASRVWDRAHAGQPVPAAASLRRAKRWAWRAAAAVVAVASVFTVALLVWDGDRQVADQGGGRPDGAVTGGSEAADTPGSGAGEAGGAEEGTALVSNEAKMPAVAGYLFVVELWPTQESLKEHRFEQALATYGIAFDDSIPVDEKLEESLLASRFLHQRRLQRKHRKGQPADSESEKKGEPEKKSGPSDLVFVVAPAKAIDRMILDLKADSDAFPKVKFDLAVKPEQLKVFQQLRQAAEMVLASHRTEESGPTAMRLDFGSLGTRQGTWRPSGQLPFAMLGGMFTMFVSQDGPPASTPAADATDAAAMAKRLEKLEQMEAEVLFIIHRPAGE